MKCRFGAVAVVLLLSVAIAMPVSAQEDDSADLNPGEGIAVGPFIFSPSVELTWEYRDNVFFDENRPVDDHVYTAKGRFMLELPYQNSYIRFVYSPKYRKYQEYDRYIPEDWSHFVDLVTAFEFGFGLDLRTIYHYVSGNLETPEIDPGLEHVWGYRQFSKHDLTVRAAYWLTHTDALFVEGGFIDLDHKKPEGFYYGDDPYYYEWAREAYFYDYSRWFFGVGWTRQMSETAKLDVRLRREEFDARETLSYRDSTSDELTIGLNGQLSETLSSAIRVGWRRTQFATSEGNPEVDDYSGLSAQGHLSWLLAHGSTLTLNVVRWDYPSAYGNNAYYTSTGGGLRYDLTMGRLYGDATVNLRRNDYELPDTETGADRSDDITQFGLGIGFWITDWLSVRGSVFREERDTLVPYEYESNIYLLGLQLGR